MLSQLVQRSGVIAVKNPFRPQRRHQPRSRPCLMCGRPLTGLEQWRNQCPHCGAKLLLQPDEQQHLHPLLAPPGVEPTAKPDEDAQSAQRWPCLKCGMSLGAVDQWRNACPNCGMHLRLLPAGGSGFIDTNGYHPAEPHEREPEAAAAPAILPASSPVAPHMDQVRELMSTGIPPTPNDTLWLFSTSDDHYAEPAAAQRPRTMRRLLRRMTRASADHDPGMNEPPAASD